MPIYTTKRYVQVARMTASVGWVSLNDATAQKFPMVQSPAGMVAVHGGSFVRADRLVMWYDVGGDLGNASVLAC